MANSAKKTDSNIKPVYVISGKDEFLVSRRCRGLVDGLLSPDERAMSLYQPRADQVQAVEVFDELRTLPFLAKRRVVLIDPADSFISDNRQAMERYFESPSRSGVLILVVGTWRKNTKLAKKLVGIGELVSVEPPTAWQLPDYVVRLARDEYGKGMSKSTAQLVVELVGDDTGRVSSEVEKLAMYVDGRKGITADDVEKLTGHNRTYDAFAVIDAVTAGDTAGAVTRLRNMFAADRSNEYTVVGAFAYHIRKMFTARSMVDGGVSAGQVVTRLGIWRNKQANFLKQLSRMSLPAIGSILAELGRIDHGIKTGQTTAPVAMERLVLKLSRGV